MGYEVYLFFAGGVILGFVLSSVVQLIKHFKTVVGVLKIDRSDPEKDLYSIEVDDLDVLKDKKRVFLTIKDVTHK